MLDWQQIINYGLPMVLMSVGAVALWRIALWIKSKIVEPFVDRHLHLINTLTEELPKQREEMQKVKAALDEINHNLMEILKK